MGNKSFKDRYTGEYKDNYQHGFGTYRYMNGNVYEGEWFMGRKSGNGIFMWADGNRYEGEFVND